MPPVCQEGVIPSEYARRGLIGTLTPQANTTVEPEFAILLPPGIASIAARMTCTAPTMDERLRVYMRELATWTAQFADAPVAAIAFACTGASYLVGAAAERVMIADAQARSGVPIVTSGRAVAAALESLSARRVAFISPYPPALTEASVAYWASFGIAAARVVRVGAAAGEVHPIYGLGAAGVRDALRALDGVVGLDAVVMLGTGMPTLRAILDCPRVGGAPVLSCTLATAWRCVLTVDREPPSADNLLAWIDRPNGRPGSRAIFVAPCSCKTIGDRAIARTRRGASGRLTLREKSLIESTELPGGGACSQARGWLIGCGYERQ